ncbi:protein-serine/threonine phosphatase [Bryobacterales bacterium F-183]|nr:protein-serine/threonine phosphatase [Bryobacterales bacterium F-183]
MVEAFGLSDLGCVRSNNEDYYLMAPNIGLYVLADGMGGAAAGERASKLAAEKVWEVIYNSGENPGIEVLADAFEQANQCVITEAATDVSLDGMGTTLVSVLEAGDELLIASVGDSRAYLFQEDQLASITADQTWVQEVGRRLGIDEENLKTHPMRHVLTMAIGVSQQLRINTYRVRPLMGALILLCSDGLHGVIDESAIADILRAENKTLEQRCHELIQAAKANGGPDNVTTVLLHVIPPKEHVLDGEITMETPAVGNA